MTNIGAINITLVYDNESYLEERHVGGAIRLYLLCNPIQNASSSSPHELQAVTSTITANASSIAASDSVNAFEEVSILNPESPETELPHVLAEFATGVDVIELDTTLDGKLHNHHIILGWG